MKRLLSIVLACCLLLGVLSVAAFAADGAYNGAPLIVISGFGTVPLYLNGYSDDAERVFFPSAKRIVKNVVQLVPPLLRLRRDADYGKFADKLDPLVFDVFSQSALDASGNPLHDVTVRTFPLTADHYMDFFTQRPKDEEAFVRGAIDTLGAKNTYFFSYDWRLDPMDHAVSLREYIKNVQRETGKQKVILAGCSMGGVVAMAYLSKYGAKDVQTLILNNTAFQGITMVGEMFCKDYAVDKEMTIEYAMQFTQMPEDLKAFIRKSFNGSRTADRLVGFAGKLLDQTKDQTSAEVLYPLFAYMPGMWSFVNAKDYERAKQTALDPELNRELIRKIDAYHYGVQAKAKQLLQNAMAQGCRIAITANYGKFAIPLTKSMRVCDDYLIDTALASGGAVCADVFETLPENYRQQRDRKHDHISPDRVIDASTCMFPELTWFVRDMGHLDYPYGSEGMDFLMWLVRMDSQYTIRTSARYPQFMRYDVKQKTLSAQ